jgi:hypothetical protein
MLKKRSFKGKKKNFLIFITFSLVVVFLATRAIDIGKIVDSEKQELQSFASSFSTVSQLFDRGDGLPLSSITKSDFIPLVSNLSKSVKDGVLKKENSNLKEIEIFIKFKHLENLLNDRKKALIEDINDGSKNVPCKVSDGTNIFKCKVKLKGNRSDHWTSIKRMSLRISVKGGYIHGMKEFAIQKPGSRQFPYDVMFHEVNNKLGRLSTNRQGFFKISFNGENWGVMNAEPVIDEKFLEVQEVKRLGTFRISNEDRSAYFRKWNDGRYLDYYIADPSVTINIKGNDNEVLANPVLKEVFSHVHLSISNKDGSIFDRQKMIANLALALTWGNTHTLGARNMFFTWNAYQQNLEPILTDQGSWRDAKEYTQKLSLPYAYRIIFDQKPLDESELMQELDKLDNFFKENNPINGINSLKDKFFPNDQRFSKTPIYDNLTFLKSNATEIVQKLNSLSNLSSSDNNTIQQKTITKEQLKKIAKVSEIFHYSDGTLRIFNLLGDTIKVESIIADTKIINVDRMIPHSVNESLSYIEIKTDLVGNYNENILVKFNINGEEKINKSDFSFTKINYELASPKEAKSFCKINNFEEECELSGELNFDESKIFHSKTIIHPGTKITLQSGVSLIFNSSVDMNGTKERPINIEGIDSGGIYIQNVNDHSSSVKNTNFSNLATVNSLLRRFTGSVNGYGGSFNLTSVSITNGEAEDQLNIVNANVKISGLEITNAMSDAFDCDFCSGTIENILISDVGGDGLDISGSDLTISKMTAKNINDKAFSVGEKSIANINNSLFDNIATGIAVKDSSIVKASNISLKNVTYDAFMTYIKKPFYEGNTRLKVNKFDIDDVDGDESSFCVREEGTDLIIDNKYCPISKINIDDLYKGRMKK